jgi:hypothetical protein
MKHPQVIGIDFDNTIVHYDHLFYRLALEQDLIPAVFSQNKTSIRDYIRTLEDGESKWICLQALAYGSRIIEAQMAEGFIEFAQQVKKAGFVLCIVSHKTEYPSRGEQVNLREAALHWMDSNKFFNGSGLNLDSQTDVFFESTRNEKMNRIRQKQCDYFIDDLIEFLMDPLFPNDVKRLHYSKQKSEQVPFSNFETWLAIENYFLA